MKKRILFLTGTRADFGKLKPLIQVVANQKDRYEYHIFVTGMHMLSRYGYTKNEISKSGFTNIYTYSNQSSDHSQPLDLTLAQTVQGLNRFLKEFPQDLIVVHGDRTETLAGAIVGSFNNVRVAHVEGGEISGTIDELIRHSVTKLSHFHFVANVEAKKTLVQMGENEEQIFVIGSPEVDIMMSPLLPSLSAVKKRYDIPYSQYGILIYHPVTTDLENTEHKVKSLTGSLIKSGKNLVVIEPNNDPGSEIIYSHFKLLRRNPRFRIIPSMRFEYYLTLLKKAEFIIGNSSSGIREAPVFGVPVFNMGTRQTNRSHNSLISHLSEDSLDLTQKIMGPHKKIAPVRGFGIGNSAKQFIDVLNRSTFWNAPIQKQFKKEVEMMI